MKIYAYIIILVMLSGAFYFTYQSGVDSQKVKHSNAIQKAVEEERKKVITVIEYKDKIRLVYRDKIKYITQVKDTTGCADIKLTDMGFGL